MVTYFNRKTCFLSFAAIVVILICIVSVYLPLTKTFYQQDEWLGYGGYLLNGLGYVFSGTGGLFGILWGEGRVLSALLYYISFKFFPFNVLPIVLFSLVFHFVNAILLFFLIKKVFKGVLPSLLGSLFFALNSVSQSAVTWAGAVAGTLPSTTLILISLFLYFNYVETNKGRWLTISFVLIYISLFFKETGIFLFLFLPFISLLFKKYSRSKFIKTFWYYLLAALVVAVIRIIELKAVPHTQALFLTGVSKFYYSSFIVRALLYPLTSFSLSIIPPTIFLNFARYITNVYYPFFPPEQFILIAQTVVLDLISIIFSIVLFVLFFYLLRITNLKIRKNVIFILVFVVASFLPYIIISKSYAYLDSRYYYLASVGWGLIFAWIFVLIGKKVKAKLISVFAVFVFLIFIFIHAKVVRSDIDGLVVESQTRISILNQISSIVPKLTSGKNIFYVTGDADFYLPGNKVPFQQGFGFTLLTWYYTKSVYPKELLSDQSLFEIGKQGYLTKGDWGFGYFSNLEDLKTVIKTNRLSKDVITAFYYNSKENRVDNITDKVVIGI